MRGGMSFHRARSVLKAELASIRQRDPDLDAGDITSFTVPLVVRAAGVAALGVIPLLVVRNGAVENSQLVPIIGSTALVLICAAVVSWLTSIVISAMVVMVLYRTRPAASSQLVVRILTDSFMRIDDSASAFALMALLAGLVSLAFGLPTRSGDEQSNPVLDDLLAAQVGVLLAVLGVAFISESVRSSVDIVDDQSLLMAWPWALLISCVSWVLATIAGPFEATRMLTILLTEWLPATVDGVSRSDVIAELVPPNARWWVALGPLPLIAAIWAIKPNASGASLNSGSSWPTIRRGDEEFRCTPDGIRTHATAVRGRRPRPLDDGGQNYFRSGQHSSGSQCRHLIARSWLGYQDSNLEWRYQKPLCCQLHHTPLAACNRWSQAVFRPSSQLTGNLPL